MRARRIAGAWIAALEDRHGSTLPGACSRIAARLLALVDQRVLDGRVLPVEYAPTGGPVSHWDIEGD